MFRGFLGQFLDNMMSSHRSNIESLLEKEGATLEMLLADPEILTECKWGNQRLINYFDHDKVIELLDYIIKMPPEDSTHERGHKFPFIASEIFNCELSKINDIFFIQRPDVQELESQQNSNKKVNYSPTPLEEDGEAQEVQYQEDKFGFGNEDSNELTTSTLKIKQDNQRHSRSNRYQVNEDEEVDHEEIDLRADETLDNPFEEQKEFQAETKEELEVQQEEEEEEEPKEEIQQETQEEQPVGQVEEVQPVGQVEEVQPVGQVEEVQPVEQVEDVQPVEQVEDVQPVEQVEDVQPIEVVEEVQTSDVLVVTDEIQFNTENQQEQEHTEEEQEQQQEEEHQQQEEQQQHQDEEETPVTQENQLDEYEIEQSISTAPTMQEVKKRVPNQFELFEHLLSFVNTDQELNPVLAGYFQKLFQVLVGNKPKEVFTYVYSHPEVLDNMVKHIAQKSVCEVLIRLLNVSDNVLEEGFDGDIDSIRQSFIFKIAQKLDPQFDFEDHLNAQSLLSELVDYKIVYQELTSQRSFEIFRQSLSSDVTSSKANTYILLQNMVQKYKSNEHFSKKINICNFQDCADEMNLEDDEDVLIFNDDKESEFFVFIKSVIKDFIAKELEVPHEELQSDVHETTYGICKQPFGIVRIRAVEFLAEAYKIFSKDLHQILADVELYDTLLFFFEHYPFHNILHSKVSEIFMVALEKNNETIINYFLYQTALIRKILDTSRENGVYTFQSTGLTMNRGYMAFMRKISNKLVELQKQNEEINNFLESIPEWAEYYDNVLTVVNNIESKPLASDPRKRGSTDSHSDDYFDLICKIKDVNRSGFQNKGNQQNVQQEENDNDEQDNEDNEEQQDQQNEESQNQEENDLFNTISRKKSRNSAHNRKGYEEQQNEEEEDDQFERLMHHDDDDENKDENQDSENNDLHQYFSNGEERMRKPWDEEDEEHHQAQPLSLNDLIDTKDYSSPQVKQQEEVVVVEQQKQAEPQITEEPAFHEQFYWKINLVNNESLEDLLSDYE